MHSKKVTAYLTCASYLFVELAAFHAPYPLILPSKNAASSAMMMASSEYWNAQDEDDEDGGTQLSQSSDWAEAELSLLKAPTEANPDLSPEIVARTCIRSLQWVDHPTPSSGLKRCFEFFTYDCRKCVTARQGGGTVERFCEYGVLSPALQPFMGAYRVDVGEGTFTAAHPPLRGALVSFPVTIYGAPVLAMQHPSGILRGGVAKEPPVTKMIMRLEQQRRPPNQGCWLVKEVLDVRHAFAGDMGNAGVAG